MFVLVARMAKSGTGKTKGSAVLRLETELVDWCNEVLLWEKQKLPVGQRRKLQMSDVWSKKLRGVIKAAHDAMNEEKKRAGRDSDRRRNNETD